MYRSIGTIVQVVKAETIIANPKANIRYKSKQNRRSCLQTSETYYFLTIYQSSTKQQSYKERCKTIQIQIPTVNYLLK